MSESIRKGAAYRASFKATGMATVDVSGVGDVLAKCPLQGLESGENVEVQQNSDGTWVVVGRQ